VPEAVAGTRIWSAAAGARICDAAIALVGTPFRLHGTDRVTGVDCVGLVLLSLRGAGMTVPDAPAYRLRAGAAALPMIAHWMALAGLDPADDRRPGDIIVVRVAPLQSHLLIQTGEDAIHAHAGLGRVVRGPVPRTWPEMARWRVPIRNETKRR
jgi:cell wall-associated NlpC family hydrolase